MPQLACTHTKLKWTAINALLLFIRFTNIVPLASTMHLLQLIAISLASTLRLLQLACACSTQFLFPKSNAYVKPPHSKVEFKVRRSLLPSVCPSPSLSPSPSLDLPHVLLSSLPAFAFSIFLLLFLFSRLPSPLSPLSPPLPPHSRSMRPNPKTMPNIGMLFQVCSLGPRTDAN